MRSAPDQIRDVVLGVLGRIAPEADLTAIEPDVGFREQLDIDSIDVLNFVIGVHEKLAVEIPEVDYPKVSTLDGCLAYLTAKLAR